MISIIYGSMNREKNLISSLDSWINSHSYITEIVVVDWSSDIPLIENQYISDLVSNKKIKLIRVENETYFSLPMSYNLAYDHTSECNKIILKLDTDYKLINNEWFNYINFSTNDTDELNNYFLVGNYKFGKSLTGFLLANKKHFVYYNENFKGWGYDDQDLYIKIQEKYPNIDKVIFFDIKYYIEHLDHTDLDRIRSYRLKDKEESREKNKKIAGIENSIRKFSTYETIDKNNNYIKLKRIDNV